MRKIKLTIIVLVLISSFGLFAQTPPHPGDGSGGGPGVGDPPVGAPIDSGLTVMLLLGAVYGSKRKYNNTMSTKLR